MATYNIRSVYPPTEDLHVGDVFAIALAPMQNGTRESLGALWSTMKIAYIPLDDKAAQYYSQVPTFPATVDLPVAGQMWKQPTTAGKSAATPASAPALASDGTANVPANHADKKHANAKRQTPANRAGPASTAPSADFAPPPSVFKPTKTWDRLPIVSFPGFTIGHADMESANASLPLRFLNFVFGASRSHADDVSITVRAAETYGVMAVDAMIALKARCYADLSKGTCDYAALRSQMASQIGHFPDDVGVILVTRVYLARNIEYTYKSETAHGVQADLLVTLQRAIDNQKALLSILNGTGKSSGSTDANGISDTQTKSDASPTGAQKLPNPERSLRIRHPDRIQMALT
ncbi:hypothetical protein [Burkholderia vietnamiensis]|uniref:hypothetical protein n=1 Tax=Burkholderia vietnamiensis TaxID=60552 RepID=UPI0012D8DC6A|nr:hypothetical protein [Burkholderia vietnamiensis]